MRQPTGNRDIAELLALAQANSALQQPQVQAQQANDARHSDLMRTALQLLGLQQQGQEADANRALTSQHYQQLFGQQQQEHQDRVAAEADRSGQFWGGELPAKYAGQANEAQNAELTRTELARHHTALEAGQAADRTTANTGNVIRGLDLINQPNANPLTTPTLEGLPGFEGLHTANEAAKAKAHAEGVKWLISQLGAVHDPAVREMYGRTLAKNDPTAYDEAALQVPKPTPAPLGPFSPGSVGGEGARSVGRQALNYGGAFGGANIFSQDNPAHMFIKYLGQLLSQPTK